MRIIQLILIGVLLVPGFFSITPEAGAEQQSLTTTIHITILKKPQELQENEDLNECFESQIKQNPQAKLEVKTEEITEEGTEFYTIYEQI